MQFPYFYYIHKYAFCQPDKIRNAYWLVVGLIGWWFSWSSGWLCLVVCWLPDLLYLGGLVSWFFVFGG